MHIQYTAENMFHPCIECLLCFFFIDSSCFRHRRQRTEKERQEKETSALSPFQRVLAERARRLEEVSFWNTNIFTVSRSVVEPKLFLSAPISAPWMTQIPIAAPAPAQDSFIQCCGSGMFIPDPGS